MVPPTHAQVSVRNGLPGARGTAAGRPAAASLGGTAAACVAAAVLVTWGADARAEHECGPPQPGVEIVCSPSSYDAARDGNIFYGPGDANEDFAIRLGEGLAIHYDREAPGDDVRVDPTDPDNPRYSAVWVTPWELGSGGAGALSLTSLADVTSNGRGISMGHYGASGPMRMEILGGTVETTGEDSHALHSYREGRGDADVLVRNATARTDGGSANAFISTHWGEGALDIDVRDTALSTKGLNADGVAGAHVGTGDVTIGLRDVSIDAAGYFAFGVFSYHAGAGHFRLEAEALAVRTTGPRGNGLWGSHWGSGDAELRLGNGSVSTTGVNADGISGVHFGEGGLEVRVEDLALATAGAEAEAVLAEHRGDGDASLDVQRSTIATAGPQAEGVLAQHEGTGALHVALRDLDIATAGHYAEGILAAHAGTGTLGVDARSVAITTTGEGSDAILAGRTLDGDVDIRVFGGALSTHGAEARGFFGVHQGDGAFALDLRDANVTTTGARGDGVAIEHEGPGPVRITVDASSVHAAGPHANGIRIGPPSPSGRVEGTGAVDDAERPDRSVTVNGPVLGGSGDGAGVLLAGGGSVFIGPQGSLGAASGVAVRAEGDAAQLLVDLQLDRRRVAEVIGDERIRNDHGETTIRVNGVVLHDGAAGATGLEAPNGARNVTITGAPTIAGRVFSREDFREDHAPRAAVYEALPGFLLGLDARAPGGERVAARGSPLWVRLSGGRGSHAPERASVGAEFAFSRAAAEAGLDIGLGEHVTAFVSARRLRGSADVTAPTGGGRIVTYATGVAMGAALDLPDVAYARGGFSRATSTSDLTSDTAGALAAGVGARVRTLDLEAGRHFAPNDDVRLTPRVRLARTFVEADGFTDPTGSRVLMNDVDRLTGGVGVVAEASPALSAGRGALSLRGSLDLARTLRGTTTRVDVPGETLESTLPDTRLLLGLGGTYRNDHLLVEANVRFGGFASGGMQYTGEVRVGWTF